MKQMFYFSQKVPVTIIKENIIGVISNTEEEAQEFIDKKLPFDFVEQIDEPNAQCDCVFEVD